MKCRLKSLLIAIDRWFTDTACNIHHLLDEYPLVEQPMCHGGGCKTNNFNLLQKTTDGGRRVGISFYPGMDVCVSTASVHHRCH